MVRVYSEDAYNLGLLYVYIYSKTLQKIVLLDDLKEFYKKIEDNLEKMNSNLGAIYATWKYDNGETIYTTSSDKYGNTYYILKDDANIERAMSLYLGVLPIDVIVASQENDSLKPLGLIKVDEKIVTINSLEKKKKDNESCNNCDYFISEELCKSIISENVEYRNMTYDEAMKQMSYCELHKTDEIPSALNCWCPNYLSHEEVLNEVKIKKLK